MFNKLLMITASLLLASVLNAETYSCNVYIDHGLLKSGQSSSINKVTFDTEENEPVALVLTRSEFTYDFNFIVTTSHQISIVDPAEKLACKHKEQFMSPNSGILMTTECQSKVENDAVVLSADCQEIVKWN